MNSNDPNAEDQQRQEQQQQQELPPPALGIHQNESSNHQVYQPLTFPVQQDQQQQQQLPFYPPAHHQIQMTLPPLLPSPQLMQAPQLFSPYSAVPPPPPPGISIPNNFLPSIFNANHSNASTSTLNHHPDAQQHASPPDSTGNQTAQPPAVAPATIPHLSPHVAHHPPQPPPPPQFQPQPTQQQHAMAMAQYYEARMRDHAAAYASAAAGAAWAAAQVAAVSNAPSKQQPQIPPSAGLPLLNPAPPQQPPENNSNNNNERRGRRRHRPHYITQGTSSSDEKQYVPRTKKYARCARSHYHHSHNSNLAHTSNSEALLGKTGACALYEWCDKRKITPNFLLLSSAEDFQFQVQLNWGHASAQQQITSRGRGGTKASAKHDAARKALQALLPGIVFDANGIVTHVPSNEFNNGPVATSHRRRHVYPSTTTTTSEEDAEEEEDENDYYASRGASVCSALVHTMWQIDERIPDPPQYSFEVISSPTALHGSKRKGRGSHAVKSHRGSFECTVTLTVKQTVTFSSPVSHKDMNRSNPQDEGQNVTTTDKEGETKCNEKSTSDKEFNGECETDRKRRAQVGHRSNKLAKVTEGLPVLPEEEDSTITNTASSKVPEEEAKPDNNNRDNDNDKREEKKQRPILFGSTREGEQGEKTKEGKQEILKAIGTGSTKREARHVASAKLLAMLFPHCNGMVEVKAAAEAARERYAATKARSKQQAERRQLSVLRQQQQERRTPTLISNIDNKTSSGHLSFALPQSTDPPLPPSLLRQIRAMATMQDRMPTRQFEKKVREDEVSVESLSLLDKEERDSRNIQKQQRIDTIQNASVGADAAAMARSTSRKQQLGELVEAALQLYNEAVDGHGNNNNTDPTVDLNECDIGRTMLRRAEPSDRMWIEKLLRRETKQQNIQKNSKTNDQQYFATHGPLSLLEIEKPIHNKQSNDVALNHTKAHQHSCLWGPIADTILLCRAIAPYDEPPLGCAVFTLGFSLLAQSRVLRVAEMGSEPHLPRERFIECLEKFALHMKCPLELPQSADRKTRLLSLQECKGVLDAYLVRDKPPVVPRATGFALGKHDKSNGTTSTGNTKAIAEDPIIQRRFAKPSKRSRLD